MEKKFINACSEGDLEEAKKLYDKGVNINAENDEAFLQSCRNGKLHVAKWLFSLPNNNININARNGYALRRNCFDTKMVEWLLSLPNINVNIYDDFIFRHNCYQRNRDMLKILIKTGKISNETVNDHVEYYNKEMEKFIFDNGYTPLNEKMFEKYEKYKN
jgi:hypothetical protein